ncbi:MAG: hypothetical protein JYX80_11150 [Candidatus Scalindua sediminis]|nr:hypothetical protein [Candidatus Scalindua sediminis]HDY69270.1 hypothetical protein [Candidatus Scalindua sp.]
MKRILFIYFLCSLICILSYEICKAQQSGYGQEAQYGESAQTRILTGDLDSLIPEISAPVELWIFVGNYRFVTGKRIHFTLQMIWKLGVSVNVEEFRNVDLSPFKIEKVTIGERQIFNNDCDFLIITYILSLSDDAKGGVYTIPSFSISYKDEVNKEVGRANTSPIALKKVPIMLDTKVDRDVVDIGDRIHYELTMWHERYVKILKENMEKLDFSPFQVIDFNIVEKSEGKLKKTTMEYELSVYDFPGNKESFEIPSLPVLYYLEHEGETKREGEEDMIKTQEIGTPAIPVIVNTLLKRIDVPLESVKGPVVHARRDVCLRGHLPIIFGVLIIIVLGVNETRRYASRFTKAVKEKIADAPLAHAEKLEKLIAVFDSDAEVNELKKSVINIDCALRVFLGALAEISREEVLSFTTTKIVDTLRSKNMAGKIVESANNTLGIFDTVIFGDIDKGGIEKAVNEVQQLLEETKKRGYY